MMVLLKQPAISQAIIQFFSLYHGAVFPEYTTVPSLIGSMRFNARELH